MPINLSPKHRDPILDLLLQNDGDYWGTEQDPIFCRHAAEIAALVSAGMILHRTDGGFGVLEGLTLTRTGRKAVNLPERKTFWQNVGRLLSAGNRPEQIKHR